MMCWKHDWETLYEEPQRMTAVHFFMFKTTAIAIMTIKKCAKCDRYKAYAVDAQGYKHPMDANYCRRLYGV